MNCINSCLALFLGLFDISNWLFDASNIFRIITDRFDLLSWIFRQSCKTCGIIFLLVRDRINFIILSLFSFSILWSGNLLFLNVNVEFGFILFLVTFNIVHIVWVSIDIFTDLAIQAQLILSRSVKTVQLAFKRSDSLLLTSYIGWIFFGIGSVLENLIFLGVIKGFNLTWKTFVMFCLGHISGNNGRL